MSTSHLPHAIAARHHGIHLVSGSKKKARTSLVTSDLVYRIAAAGAALVLLMVVC